jgi:DHA1 family bicyclomycin/chloramphenicol resistance-like MFS transporter
MPAPIVTRRLPLLLGFLIAVGPVSTDMYLAAFPAIARDFHNLGAPQISLAAYFVGLAIGQMTLGALSDRLGRRRPLLVGLVIYTLASLGCAVCWSVSSFAVFRFLTALGASAGVVIPRAMVRDLADGPAAAKLFSKLMLVMGAAPILAPMLGSLSMTLASWRLIFVLASIYGVLAVVLVWHYLPETLPLERRTELGPGAVAMRYVEIFKERHFISHALVLTSTAAALFGFLSGSPQIFVGLYGWSPAGYAALFGVSSIAYIGFNQLNPILVSRYGIAPVITVAVNVLLVSTTLLVLLAWHPLGPFPIMAALLVGELGFGLAMPSAMVGALSHHQAHAGSASALMGTLQYSGGALSALAIGAWAENSETPMAVVMLVCAGLAVLAASLRPRVILVAAETWNGRCECCWDPSLYQIDFEPCSACNAGAIRRGADGGLAGDTGVDPARG